MRRAGERREGQRATRRIRPLERAVSCATAANGSLMPFASKSPNLSSLARATVPSTAGPTGRLHRRRSRTARRPPRLRGAEHVGAGVVVEAPGREKEGGYRARVDVGVERHPAARQPPGVVGIRVTDRQNVRRLVAVDVSEQEIRQHRQVERHVDPWPRRTPRDVLPNGSTRRTTACGRRRSCRRNRSRCPRVAPADPRSGRRIRRRSASPRAGSRQDRCGRPAARPGGVPDEPVARTAGGRRGPHREEEETEGRDEPSHRLFSRSGPRSQAKPAWRPGWERSGGTNRTFGLVMCATAPGESGPRLRRCGWERPGSGPVAVLVPASPPARHGGTWH